jgi:hypothetical protein
MIMVAVLSIAGCAYVDPGHPNPTVIDPAVSTTETDSGFHMNGTIQIVGPYPEKGEFRNLVVCFYSEEKTLIRKTKVGDLVTAKEKLPVSVNAERVPEYIIINSTDFWEVSEMRVKYLARSKAAEYGYSENTVGYRGKRVTSPDGFPVQCPANASG